MQNLEVAWAFREIADLLELKGEDVFKTRAYRKAAQVVETWPEDLAEVAAADRLMAIPGIGRALAEKIQELITTGRSQYLDELRAAFPPTLRELMSVPGLGAKTAALVFERLGIATLEALEQAARQHRLSAVPGLGARKEAAILAGLEAIKRRSGRVPFAQVWPMATAMAADLQAQPMVERVALAGDLRRRVDMVSGIDLVVATTDPGAVLTAFGCLPVVKTVREVQPGQAEAVTAAGWPARLTAVPPSAFAPALVWQTGSEAHRARLVERAIAAGLDFTAVALGGSAGADEEALYHHLGLEWVPPELREDRGEIGAATAGHLPRLIKRADVRGDLHNHSRWSDGKATLSEMAAAATALGYAYLGICDHSRSLTVAGGLDMERLALQWREIDALNAEFRAAGHPFRLLKGTEVDILRDGSLDFPDEILARADVVVASIHSGFQMSEAEITARLVRAMKNPHVDIIGHATGRLLGRREPYAVNMDRVLDAARDTGTVLEINAQWDRLDINDLWAQQAAGMGIRLAINTDAHSTEELGGIEHGIGQARRGWVQAVDVINTLPAAGLLAYLGAHKPKA